MIYYNHIKMHNSMEMSALVHKRKEDRYDRMLRNIF